MPSYQSPLPNDQGMLDFTDEERAKWHSEKLKHENPNQPKKRKKRKRSTSNMDDDPCPICGRTGTVEQCMDCYIGYMDFD
jgi:hypothetical protein